MTLVIVYGHLGSGKTFVAESMKAGMMDGRGDGPHPQRVEVKEVTSCSMAREVHAKAMADKLDQLIMVCGPNFIIDAAQAGHHGKAYYVQCTWQIIQ